MLLPFSRSQPQLDDHIQKGHSIVSNPPYANGERPFPTSTCCWWTSIAALVFLRLCIGGHFFSEGIKKVEVDSGRGVRTVTFSSEGFLRQAKGPLANFYHSKAPSTSDWQRLLAVPQETTPADLEELTNWVTRYVAVRRRQLEKQEEGNPEFPDFAPYAAWAEQIKEDWAKVKQHFTSLSKLTDEQRERAVDVLEQRELDLSDLLAESALDMQEYQHELWRLEKAQAEGGADEIPFRQERIATQGMETTREPLKWVAGVRSLRDSLAADLTGLLTEDQRRTKLRSQADRAVSDPQVNALARMDVLITCLITGIGACLLMGLFTRVAALAGAAFLLSVMATQPPWVPGANTMYFYYQLVEFAALLLLAATAAGRYAGLDFIIHSLWARRRGSQGAKP